MRISVIIPIYNGEKYIRKAVKSVCRQPYRNLEIVCVNDGSVDESSEIVREMAKNDSRIKLLEKKNGGVGSARNAGLDVATGDYVAFLDQDDIWLKAISEQLVEEIEKNSCDMVAFSSYCSNRDITRVKPELRENSLVTNNFETVPMRHHSSYLYRREFLLNNGIYTDRFDGIDYNFRNEDTRFLIQCYAKTRSIQSVSIPLFVYRNNESSVVHTSNGERTLITSLDGFQMLGDKTDNEEIRRVCRYYTTRYFLELAEIISLDANYQGKAEQYVLKYHISDLLSKGYASNYSKAQYSLWHDDPKQFWNIKKKSRRKQIIKTRAARVSLFRKLFHIRKYPIRFYNEMG